MELDTIHHCDALDESIEECQALTDELTDARMFIKSCGVRMRPHLPLIDGVRLLLDKVHDQYQQQRNTEAADVQQLDLFDDK